jgi:uncharacterized small protein (DUF1192 family)
LFYLNSIESSSNYWIDTYGADGAYFRVSRAGNISASGATLTNVTVNQGTFEGITLKEATATSDFTVKDPYGDSSILTTSSLTIKDSSRNNEGYFNSTKLSVGDTTGNGVEIEASANGNGYLRGKGSQMIVFYNNYAKLSGSWKSTSSIIVDSDRILKYDIEEMPDKYEILFDALQPCLYKYENGTSGRKHSGFIAQDVLSALSVANISTTDFAGYVEMKTVNTETGEDEIICGLRYEEFIALAVHKIQKLTPRISATEQEILSLKQEISELRAEIQNLKNS